VLRNRYVLERELGRGGMGTVYRALGPQQARPAAAASSRGIKVLREELARRPDALQILRREAHQAQSLSIPASSTSSISIATATIISSRWSCSMASC